MAASSSDAASQTSQSRHSASWDLVSLSGTRFRRTFKIHAPKAHDSRCNGVWRLDPDTCPHTRFQEGDKNRSTVCVDCDAIVRVDVVRGALVRDLVKQRLDGDLVVDRTIVPPKPIEFVKFNFVVPDKEK